MSLAKSSSSGVIQKAGSACLGSVVRVRVRGRVRVRVGVRGRVRVRVSSRRLARPA